MDLTMRKPKIIKYTPKNYKSSITKEDVNTIDKLSKYLMARTYLRKALKSLSKAETCAIKSNNFEVLKSITNQRYEIIILWQEIENHIQML
jgi:hypothetical protein